MATTRALGGTEAPPVAQLDSRLLGARARAAILQAIFDGRLEGKLPSEDRLAEMLSVSRTTVRTALQGLERDGVVTRRRAIGTIINPHVRPSSLTLHRLVGFDWLLRERGHEVEVDITWHWGVVGKELASVFAADADQECVLIEKQYRADGTVALVVTDVLPRDSLLTAELPDVIEPSLFSFSEAYCTAAIHHAVVEMVPMVKRARTTKLPIANGQPFMRLHETHYTVDGEAIAFSRVDTDDSFIRLEIVRTQ